MDIKTALNEILKLAHKHEVQYWLDAPGTDAEKLVKIVRICRDALDEQERAHEVEGETHAAALEQEEADRLDAEDEEKDLRGLQEDEDAELSDEEQYDKDQAAAHVCDEETCRYSGCPFGR